MSEPVATDAPAEAPALVDAPAPAPAPAIPGSPLGEAPEGASTESAPEGASTETSPEPAALSADSYELKLPEGVILDEASVSVFKEQLVAASVPPEAAQSLLDLHTSEMAKAATAWADAQQAAWTTTVDGWKSAIASDPDIGGAKQAETQLSIARALDEYGTPETRAAFDLTGAGWNPGIIKFVAKMAAALSEGSLRAATDPPRDPKSRDPAAVLYPNGSKVN